MGKAALLFALAAAITTMWMTSSTTETTMDTQDAQIESYSNQMARDLAIRGRKLALANWIAASGDDGPAPFQSYSENGGKISITNYEVESDVLDVTVRAEYEGAVHDLRSQYQWNPGGALNAFQIKAAKVDLEISALTTLDIPSVTIDDNSVTELNDVLITGLGLADNLTDLGFGADQLSDEVTNELSGSGNSSITVEMIDSAARLMLEQEPGLFFPEQVESALGSYLNANPGVETIISDGNSLPATFGTDQDGRVLRITDNLDINGNFVGKGILIVEGNLNIPEGSSFDWNGLVIVKPPAENKNPRINFVGDVNIQGGLVAMQEAVPNSGHMDITTFRDMNGTWSQAQGPERKLWYWDWCMYHKHDFTSAYGNAITYYSNQSSERIHEGQIHLNETLNSLNGTDEVFFELYNTDAHGRGSVTMELNGESRVSNSVAAGFESSVASPTNDYRSKTFRVSDLKYMHIDILRLSSLKKMWDTGVIWPGCISTSGPKCVGYSRSRYGSLTLALYKIVGASEYKLYESSMYWHRRTDEIDEYNDKMTELLEDLQSEDYGLDIYMGDQTTLVTDPGSISMLMGDDAAGAGAMHMGSWSAYWGPHHPDNPVH